MTQIMKKGFGLLVQSARPLRLCLDPFAGASGTCRSIPSFDRCRRHYSVFEPEGLNEPPEIPEYEALNIRLRGYDFVTLESFAKFTHGLVKSMGLSNDSFANPATTCKVQTYKPNSTNLEHEYELAEYERTVQIEDVPNTLVPLLLETLQLNSPEGVNLTIKHPTEEEHDFRYVPDVMLNSLEAELDAMKQAREDKRKK